MTNRSPLGMPVLHATAGWANWWVVYVPLSDAPSCPIPPKACDREPTLGLMTVTSAVAKLRRSRRWSPGPPRWPLARYFGLGATLRGPVGLMGESLKRRADCRSLGPMVQSTVENRPPRRTI